MNSQEIEYNRLGEESFTKRGAVSPPLHMGVDNRLLVAR